MELIKRSTKGEALTWDDLDGNWLAIESSINNIGQRKLYQIEDVTVTDSCSLNGVNTLSLAGRVRILEGMDELPIIKACVVVNGVIEMSGTSDDMFVGCTFPFVAGTVGLSSTMHEIDLDPGDYPVNIKLHVWDEKGNYAEPHHLSISEPPCSYISMVSCSVAPNMTTYTRTLNLVANVKGSGLYILQYKDEEDWIGLMSISADNGELNESIPLANNIKTGIVQVRMIDSIAGNLSNEVSVNFAYADWYAWHHNPECVCDGVQRLVVQFYLGAIPSSDIVIEYEYESGVWVHLHTFSYTTPINLTIMGGGTIDIDVPEGTYNVRIRNLLTGTTLVAEDVAFPNCSTPTLDIEILSAEVVCDEDSGYLRKLGLDITIDSGSGNYKVQQQVAGEWIDMHEFSTEAGSIDVDFYIDNTIVSGMYQIRIVDISNAENYSNNVEVDMQFADSYSWNVEPESICDETIQKLQLSVNYNNVPEGELIVEVYSSSTWMQIATIEYTSISTSGTETFGSPITLPEVFMGEYNIRVRNTITGTTLLATDIPFAGCSI